VVLSIQEVSGVYTFCLTDRIKKWICEPEKFPGLSRNGPLEFSAPNMTEENRCPCSVHRNRHIENAAKDGHINNKAHAKVLSSKPKREVFISADVIVACANDCCNVFEECIRILA